MSKHKMLTDKELAEMAKHAEGVDNYVCRTIRRLLVQDRELKEKLDRVMNVKSIRVLLADNARLKEAVGYDGESLAGSLRFAAEELEDGADVRVWTEWLVTQANRIDDIFVDMGS